MRAFRGESFRERPAYNLVKRLRRSVLRRLNRWSRGSYDVCYVSVDGRRYKKVTFKTAADADRVFKSLKAFGASPHFPVPAERRENEVLVEFVPGSRIGLVDEGVLEKLSDFYAAVYTRAPRLVSLQESGIWPDFVSHLSFLRQAGALEGAIHDLLYEKGKRLAPERVWVGFDYKDPVTKNLVVREGEDVISAVDIKNLRAGGLIGRGIVKARICWLSAELAQGFVESLIRKGVPDFSAYWPFLELVYETARRKNKLAKRAANGLIKGFRSVQYSHPW